VFGGTLNLTQSIKTRDRRFDCKSRLDLLLCLAFLLSTDVIDIIDCHVSEIVRFQLVRNSTATLIDVAAVK